MKLRHLEIFQAILRTGSVSAAAEVIGLSQPAVSVILKHAESQLGMKLFERVRGRLHPTPEALSLAPDVEMIFTRLEGLSRRAETLRDGRAGMLTIAAPPQLAAGLLTRAVSEFCAERPEVRVVIRSAPTSQVIEIILRQQAELGIVYSPFGSRTARASQIGTTEISCVMHPASPLADYTFVSPAMLGQMRIICYRPGTPLRMAIEKAFQRVGVPLDVHVETSALIACSLAMQQAGVALIDPLIMIGGLFPGLARRPFVPTTRLGIQVITSRDWPISSLTKQFAEFLEATLHLQSPNLASHESGRDRRPNKRGRLRSS